MLIAGVRNPENPPSLIAPQSTTAQDRTLGTADSNTGGCRVYFDVIRDLLAGLLWPRIPRLSPQLLQQCSIELAALILLGLSQHL